MMRLVSYYHVARLFLCLSALSSFSAWYPFSSSSQPSMKMVALAQPSSTCDWIPLGQQILGTGLETAAGQPERFGQSVALSGDGNVMAATGRLGVRVFQNINNVWTQRGSAIPHQGIETRGLESKLSLSDDGSLLAVGSPGNDDLATNAGRAQVFQWTSPNWAQLGANIYGRSEANHGFGGSVAISGDGQVLIVASRRRANFNGETLSGWISTYRRSNTSCAPFEKVGTSLATTVLEGFGNSLELSQNGQSMVVGAPDHDESQGRMWVFDFDEPTLFWQRKGSNLEGSAYFVDSETFGKSVAISAGGSVVAAIGNTQLAVFRFDTLQNDWTPIVLQEWDDQELTTVDLSAEGDSMAYGARFGTTSNGGGIPNTGLVASFFVNNPIPNQIGESIPGSSTVDAAGRVAMSDDGTVMVVGSPGSDLAGTNGGKIQAWGCSDEVISPPTQAPITVQQPVPTPPPTPQATCGGGYKDPCVSGSDCCSKRCLLNQCQKGVNTQKRPLASGRGGAGGAAKEGTTRRLQQENKGLRGES
jgi:hypothetical protein